MKILGRMLLTFLISLALCGCNSYTCSSPHCYGIVEFSSPGIEGFGMFVDVGHMLNTGDGFVDNEIWIVDRGNRACNGTNQSNMCWVEVGYLADNGTVAGNAGASGLDPHFFWADSRPNGGFVWHDLGGIPDTYYGQKVFLLILKQGTNTWSASVYPIGIQGAPTLTGTSTNNAMTPQSGLMGQELFGTKGGTAGPVTYTVTGIKAAGSSSPLLSTVTTDGSVTSNNPPRGTWLTKPSVPSANGGVFQTGCCS